MAGELLSPGQLMDFGKSLMASLVSVSNFYFWKSAGYFDSEAESKPLLHTWSLAVEEQFYLFWPLLIFLCHNRSRLFLSLVLASAALISLALNQLVAEGWGPDHFDIKASLYYLLPFRTYEFVFGAFLSQANTNWTNEWHADVVLWIGLSLILYPAVTFTGELLFPSYYALMPCTGAALVILIGSKCKCGRVLDNALAARIGVLSYSLYLVHWPIVVFAKGIVGELNWSHRFILLAMCFVLAVLLQILIERPFQNPASFLRQKSLQPLFIFATIILFTVGSNMSSSGGWLWRVPEIQGVVFDRFEKQSQFHQEFYGGAGYPSFGPVNTNQPADIVVMGDSHGRQYLEGVFKVVSQPMNLSLYSASGTSCFHLPHFTRKTEVDWDTHCPEALTRGLDFIHQGNQPLVILAHSWVNQINRAALLDAQGRRISTHVTINDIVTGILELRELIGASQLVVIGHVPMTGGINLYDEFTKPHLFKEDRTVYFTSPKNPLHVQINQVLKDAANRTGAFSFMDPFDVLCNKDDELIDGGGKEGRCKNVDGEGHLVYSDGGHLSKYGSVDVIRGFLPQFHSLLAAEEH